MVPDRSDTFGTFRMLCNLYAQLAARGTSVIFATGDGGVEGRNTGADARFCLGDGFGPTFPATCPLYVLRCSCTPYTD